MQNRKKKKKKKREKLTLVNISLVTEGVETQRCALDTIGQADGFVEVLHGQDGDEGAEALLRAHGVINRVNLNNGGLDEQLLLIHSATHKDLALSIIKHGLETSEGGLIDDARVIRRALGTLRVELLVCILEFPYDLRNERLVDQQVVLRGAELAGVQELAPEHAAGDETWVRTLGDDGWVYTTQLEHDGGQVLCSGLGDDASDGGTACEEDLVPPFREQGLCLGDTALDDCVAGGVETGLDNLLHDGGAAGGIFARLDHHCVSGGDGTNGGAESQLEGEVEGTRVEKSLLVFGMVLMRIARQGKGGRTQ